MDVGTNAIRFFAVEFQDQERFRVIAEERYPIRFGHGVFTVGRMMTRAPRLPRWMAWRRSPCG